MVWLALLLQPLCLIQVKKQECGGKTIKDLFIFLKRTHVFQTGTVNMQGFVWKFLCTTYTFSLVHSFIEIIIAEGEMMNLSFINSNHHCRRQNDESPDRIRVLIYPKAWDESRQCIIISKALLLISVIFEESSY